MALKMFVLGTFRNVSRNMCTSRLGMASSIKPENPVLEETRTEGMENQTGKVFDPKEETKKEVEIRMKLLDSWDEKHEKNWKMSGRVFKIIKDGFLANNVNINRDKLVMEVMNKLNLDVWKDKYGVPIEVVEKVRVRTDNEITKVDGLPAIWNMIRDKLVMEVENKLKLVNWEEKYNNLVSHGEWEQRLDEEEMGEVRRVYEIIKVGFLAFGNMNWNTMVREVENKLELWEERYNNTMSLVKWQQRLEEEEEEEVIGVNTTSKDGFLSNNKKNVTSTTPEAGLGVLPVLVFFRSVGVLQKVIYLPLHCCGRYNVSWI